MCLRMGVILFHCLFLSTCWTFTNAASNDRDLAIFFQLLRTGQIQSVISELEKGRDVNQADQQGITAIMIAAEAGRADVVIELLRRGANPNLENKSGQTALTIAAAGGHMGVLGAIRDNTERKENREPAAAATSPPVQKRSAQDDLNEELIRASGAGNLSQIKGLLGNGAEINANGRDFGATPLMWTSMAGHLEGARYLLDRGALIDAKDKDGRTALMWAAAQGHVPLVKLLLSRGSDPALKDASGVTAIAAATTRGHKDIVKLLSRALGEPDPNQQKVSKPTQPKSHGERSARPNAVRSHGAQEHTMQPGHEDTDHEAASRSTHADR